MESFRGLERFFEIQIPHTCNIYCETQKDIHGTIAYVGENWTKQDVRDYYWFKYRAQVLHIREITEIDLSQAIEMRLVYLNNPLASKGFLVVLNNTKISKEYQCAKSNLGFVLKTEKEKELAFSLE